MQSQFQFHKGTIKTNLKMDMLMIFVNFNSIKVRLKPFLDEDGDLFLPISIP